MGIAMDANHGAQPHADQVSSSEVTGRLWAAGGGTSDALGRLTLTGAEPALPSSFYVGVAAQSTIAVTGLAATNLWELRTGRCQQVSVGMRHAAAEFRSERYLRVAGKKLLAPADVVAGVYRTRDRHLRIHTSFPHHRAAVLQVLGCAPNKDEIRHVLSSADAVEFETRALKAGAVVAAARTYEEWMEHPQAQALGRLPVLTIEKIGEAAPWPLGQGASPLSGVRVLDLTRVIAGPVGCRALAAYGATVLRISAAELPSIDWLDKDTARGKLSAFADIKTDEGRSALRRLVSNADVFVQGFRPNAVAAQGFSPEDVASIRPGIVYVTLSAYGHAGPWAQRRGFDSLVQTVSGYNYAEAAAFGRDGLHEMPCQSLDHASGYLIAFGAMMAKARQAQEGGSWHVRVSLAQTGRWLWNLGRLADGPEATDPNFDDVQDLIERSESPFGEVQSIRHAALLSETPAAWTRPVVPLGTHAAEWPDL